MHPPPPPPSLSAGGVEPPTKFSKREGGWQGLNFLREVAGKEGVTFFRGKGLQFLHEK